MSRFFHHGEYDGDGPPPEFWHRAVHNSLRGKKGQEVLRELREALLTLPQPRLLEGVFAKEGEVCAMGALARYRFQQGKTLAWGSSILASLPAVEERLGDDLEDEYVTVELGEGMGLKRAMAWGIAWENDEGTWANETPEQRYARVLHWVEENLA